MKCFQEDIVLDLLCCELNDDYINTNIENCLPSSAKVLTGERGDTTSIHIRCDQLESGHNDTSTLSVSIEDQAFRRGVGPLTAVTNGVKWLKVNNGKKGVRFPAGRISNRIFETTNMTNHDFSVKI